MKKYLSALTFLYIFTWDGYGQSQDYETWKDGRVEELTAEDGWLNLVGLLWIDEEKIYLNEESDSLEVSSVAGKKNIGNFHFVNDSVWFFFHPKVAKKHGIQAPAKTLVYPLEYGKGGGAYYDHWKWTVIQRGGQYAVRLRDLEHPGVKNFHSIPSYGFDPAYRIQAFFEPRFNQTIEVPNVLGQMIEWKVMGILKFELDGKPQELTVLDELGKFFVIFSDQTNNTETYPTGRYLYVSYPDRSGNTEIDFNYAYNPPCAFTSFATCPIPPKQNRLEVAVLAGEKKPDGH